MRRPRKYPKEDDLRSGCKVAWLIYRKHSDAKKAAEVAKWDAAEMRNLGYDFGYCMPGSITKLEDGRYEVCIP